MAFQHPTLEAKGTITPETHGRRKARRKEYFNPYSIITQNKQHREFEYGWKDEMSKINPDQVTTRTKHPALAVLILGILLVGLFYWAFM